MNYKIKEIKGWITTGHILKVTQPGQILHTIMISNYSAATTKK